MKLTPNRSATEISAGSDSSEKSEFQGNLEIERFLVSFAINFINLNPEEIDEKITAGLKEITNYLQVDRGFIYLIKNSQTSLVLTHHYYQDGIKGKIRQHEQVDKEDFHWLMRAILVNKPINVSCPADISAKSSTIKLIMDVEHTKSMLLWPLSANEKIIGFLGLDRVKEEKKFDDDQVYLVEKSAAIIAASFNRRKQAQIELMREKKYKNLFSEIEDVVFISTPKGKFLEINNAGVKLFGYNSVPEVLQ